MTTDSADFLVIGGGIAGVSAAARLAALGRVILLEAEAALGYHASGRSAALFEEHYGLPATVALNRASRAEHAARGVLSPRGLLLVGGPHEAAAVAAEAAAMRLRPIPAAEACAMVPILNPAAVAHAAHSDAAQDIDTDRLLQGFAREARANGRIVTGARVTALVRGGAGWVAETARGAFEGRLVVNAAGAWADQVAAMAGVPPLGLRPLRRSMARLAAPGGHDVSRWPMIFGAGESWYAKPDAGALLVSPAEEDPAEPHDAWADDLVLAEGLARYEAMVTVPVTRPIATWAGLRTFTPDRCLALGPAPGAPGFWWCAGQGGYGMQTSPAASRLLADRIAGRAPELDPATVAALDPARFR
jgi:glycine/D-amino acid oxidase-like deaminating enzyme